MIGRPLIVHSPPTEALKAPAKRIQNIATKAKSAVEMPPLSFLLLST